jgi:hypothetical protein
VPGSLLEKHRLNIITETLITVYERGRGRLFWLSINGDAIRVKTRFPTPGYVARSEPEIGDEQAGRVPPITQGMSIKH